MRAVLIGALLFTASGLAACSDDDSSNEGADSGAGGSGSSTGGKSAAGGKSATGGEASANGGSTSASGGSAGEASDAGSRADGSSGDCTSARATLLGSIDSVSSGEVSILGDASGVKKLFVDGSAGGPTNAATSPWIFVNLGTGKKVEVTDPSSLESTDWDLAIKRPIIYTNGGDGGPGKGGAVLVSKGFDDVARSDTTGATFATESFFDAECNANTDPTGAALTSFSSWYDYDENTHLLSPHEGTWLVRGGTGDLYKLKIDTYYGTPDGGTGQAGGFYVLDVGAL
jgi:hypothetical protein